MNKKDKINNRILKRVSVLSIAIILMIIVMIGRLFLLQIVDKKYKQSMHERIRFSNKIDAKRGSIVDRNGYELAYDEQIAEIIIYPEIIRKSFSKKISLSLILEKSMTEIEKLINTDEDRIEIQISSDIAFKAEELSIYGLFVEYKSGRRYVDGKLTGNIIGFVDGDREGVIGLEAYYDEYLKGKDGKIQYYSYQGRPIPIAEKVQYEPEDGYSLNLTLDADLQSIVLEAGQNAIEKFEAEKISIIAMDPRTGEILSIGDFPALDGNAPRTGRNEKEKSELDKLSEENKLNKYFDMWRSFSYQDIYEPGSVFKLITAAAAYEEGTADDSTIYHCDGYIEDIPGITIRCWSHLDPHGYLDFQRAMDESCNPAFVQMIRELGKDKSRKYIDAFGFSNVTKIDLPMEAESIVPPQPEEINEGTFATNSYGHGIAVSPIQMINGVSAIVNGGNLMQPHLVKEIVDKDGNIIKTYLPKKIRQVISETTSERMREIMTHGVEFGTADGGYIDGFSIGGKTGTSVKFVDGAYSMTDILGSFVGVYPSDNPEIVILCVVDEPKDFYSGNSTAAPIVKEILKGFIELKGYGQFEKEKDTIEIEEFEEPVELEIDEVIIEEGDYSEEVLEGYSEEFTE